MMDVPAGWKLVPIKPTLAMCTAYERAMKEFVNKLPVAVRHRYRYYPKGFRVPEAVKVKIRWEAMVKAAPAHSNGMRGGDNG